MSRKYLTLIALGAGAGIAFGLYKKNEGELKALKEFLSEKINEDLINSVFYNPNLEEMVDKLGKNNYNVIVDSCSIEDENGSVIHLEKKKENIGMIEMFDSIEEAVKREEKTKKGWNGYSIVYGTCVLKLIDKKYERGLIKAIIG